MAKRIIQVEEKVPANLLIPLSIWRQCISTILIRY